MSPAENGPLAPCPASPNCVSSDATDSVHRIDPLSLGKDPQAVWQALLDYLKAEPSYRIIKEQEQYIHAENRTRILRFVDDVEFQMRPEDGLIAMRSASRIGLSDLGKNRRRLESLRRALQLASP